MVMVKKKNYTTRRVTVIVSEECSEWGRYNAEWGERMSKKVEKRATIDFVPVKTTWSRRGS